MAYVRTLSLRANKDAFHRCKILLAASRWLKQNSVDQKLIDEMGIIPVPNQRLVAEEGCIRYARWPVIQIHLTQPKLPQNDRH